MYAQLQQEKRNQQEGHKQNVLSGYHTQGKETENHLKSPTSMIDEFNKKFLSGDELQMEKSIKNNLKIPVRPMTSKGAP